MAMSNLLRMQPHRPQSDGDPNGHSAASEMSAMAVVREHYDRFGPRLLAYLASRAPRSEVDDLFQEVWLRVATNYAQQFDGGSFGAWLFGIARNLIIDRA